MGAKRDYPGVETPGHEDVKSPGLGGLGLVVRLFMGYFTDTVMLPVVVPERKRSTKVPGMPVALRTSARMVALVVVMRLMTLPSREITSARSGALADMPVMDVSGSSMMARTPVAA